MLSLSSGVLSATRNEHRLKCGLHSIKSGRNIAMRNIQPQVKLTMMKSPYHRTKGQIVPTGMTITHMGTVGQYSSIRKVNSSGTPFAVFFSQV